MSLVYLLAIFFLFYPVFGQTLLTPEKIELINLGNCALMNGRWASALEIYSKISKVDSIDPGGFLFRAGVLQAEMMDCERNLYAESFPALLDSTRIFAERKLKSCGKQDSALCYLYLGHQLAYRSLYEARFGSSFSALEHGLKAKGEYHKGLTADSSLYDLYLGLGSYHYWKSVKAGILTWTGIFKNDREKGIREIHIAIDSALFSKESARSALIWIFIHEKKYDSAVVLADDFYRKYPEGKTFLWPLGEAYYKSEHYTEAEKIYIRLFNILKAEEDNFYNLIESGYWVIKCIEKTGNRVVQKEISKYINSVYKEIPKDIRREQKSKLSYIAKSS
jgi:tetratricopeptide (TPR) repeat protein